MCVCMCAKVQAEQQHSLKEFAEGTLKNVGEEEQARAREKQKIIALVEQFRLAQEGRDAAEKMIFQLDRCFLAHDL